VSRIPAGVEASFRCNSSAILSPACGAATDFSTSRLAAAHLTGKASGALLPKLDGVQVEYHFSAEASRAIKLAQTLTVLGITDPGAWDEAKHSPARYLGSIAESVGEVPSI